MKNEDLIEKVRQIIDTQLKKNATPSKIKEWADVLIQLETANQINWQAVHDSWRAVVAKSGYDLLNKFGKENDGGLGPNVINPLGDIGG
jgi:hypothetical protein